MKKTGYIILAAVALLILWGISLRNGLVRIDESVSQQWANVESSYQRRADLIPNLVSTVKGYANFEQTTLTQVIEARAKATSINVDASKLTPESIAQFEEAQQGLSSALSRLLVTVEQYPDLKANQNFLELQSQLEGTENRINVERRKYNEVVQKYNSAIRVFPKNIFANSMGLEKKGYFQAAEGSENVPTVQF